MTNEEKKKISKKLFDKIREAEHDVARRLDHLQQEVLDLINNNGDGK